MRFSPCIPGEPWIVAQSAALDQRMGRYVEACEGWQRLADLAPGSTAPWYHRSHCAPDDETRAAELQRMLQVVPDHAPTVEEQLLLAQRRGEKASICDRAVELGRLARYSEQFARAHDAFLAGECSDLGFDFWGETNAPLTSDDPGSGHGDRSPESATGHGVSHGVTDRIVAGHWVVRCTGLLSRSAPPPPP
jgi:hypothetical protein